MSLLGLSCNLWLFQARSVSVHARRDLARGVGQPFHRVAPYGSIPLRDVGPFHVFPEAEKHPLGALVRATVKHNFVTFTKCVATCSVICHVRNLFQPSRQISEARNGTAPATN